MEKFNFFRESGNGAALRAEARNAETEKAMKYYERKDLFGYVCSATQISFDSQEIVGKYFHKDGQLK